MKRLAGLLTIIGLLAIITAISVLETPAAPTSSAAQPSPDAASPVESTLDVSLPILTPTPHSPEFMSTLEAFHTQLIEDIGQGEWLYRTYKTETGFDFGTAPDTGEPLPRQDVWEMWYQLDSQGVAQTIIRRRTGLDTGSVETRVWADGDVLGVEQGTERSLPQQGEFSPLNKDFCIDAVVGLLQLPNVDESTAEGSAAEGPYWALTLEVEYDPPIANVYGYEDTEMTARRLVCTRDAATGGLIELEIVDFTADGRSVLIERIFDARTEFVEALPPEIAALLEE